MILGWWLFDGCCLMVVENILSIGCRLKRIDGAFRRVCGEFLDGSGSGIILH